MRQHVITRRTLLGGLATAGVLAVASAWAGEPPATPAVSAIDGSAPEETLTVYRALSASQARNYDRRQDISPQQLVILLEVSERAGANLGQALATGEFESARTWNDHIRPTLKSGSLGSATGVWQFQPATFHSILEAFGAQILAASGADAATGRPPMDLGTGPFTDAQVRGLIRDTVDGRRGADDAEVQLLRHNFSVLAFAKHYLSVDSGAATPEEDYLFHFLGEGQGRRILALARGEAQHTLCVKPAAPLDPALEPAIAELTQLAAASRLVFTRPADPGVPPINLHLRGEPRAELVLGSGRRVAPETAAAQPADPWAAVEPALFSQMAPTPVSAEWGLPADSPTVTGNLGMFYRDGKGQSEPYTWAEFLEHLGSRVRVADQPALVRAKYGVGFPLEGGDMPGWAFDPELVSSATEFRHANEQAVLVPAAMVTGTLDRDETLRYKKRLAELVNRAEDRPLDTLPPESLAALHHFGLLDPKVQATDTRNPKVRRALHDFRKRVGKDEPDDPEHAGRLMPAERVALELYEHRIAHYAALQAGQDAALGDALNLVRIRKLPARFQRLAAPYVAEMQTSLADRGLLTQPTHKRVWRDKKRKKHTRYEKVPFSGKPGKATVAALNTFQLRHGLRQTDGVADAVTLEALGLPPVGLEVFLPPSGPHCAIDGHTDALPLCEVPARLSWGTIGVFSPNRPRALPWILNAGREPGDGEPHTGPTGSDGGECER